MPKALVEIGGKPILWHVIGIYAAQGFQRFLLATGYLGEAVEEFVAAEAWPDGVTVECVDTGPDTPTGGRIAALADRLGGDTFCATYADGVADIDLGALLDFHAGHGGLATMTVVRPHLQWGVAELAEDGRVEGFAEKPRSEHWINGGFFCFEPGALAYLDEDSVLEREPLARLAAATASCAPTATRASGTAWTPTRTRSSSMTSGRRERRRGAPTWSIAALSPRAWGKSSNIGCRDESGAGQRRARVRRLASGAGAARERGGGAGARPAGAAARRRRRRAALGPRPARHPRGGRAGRGRPARRRGGRRGRGGRRIGLPPRRADDRRGGARIAAGDLRGQRARRLERLRGLPGHGVARVVFASSDKAYGSSPELPYREDFPLRGINIYDAGKAAADTIARSYANAYGLPLAVTRFANVYGGGDLNFSRLIPETVVAVLDGRAPVIRSDGSPERDFLHVDDAVSAYLAIAAALGGGAAGEAFNAGGERPHSVREVVESIAAAEGGSVEPDFQGAGNPDGEIDRQFVDSSKLRELTGWRPEVALEDGLRRTLEWYREHAEARPAKAAA